MSVLLVNPPRIIGDGNIWKKIDRSLPPLGLAYIASFLENNNQVVKIIDLQAENVDAEHFITYISELKPDFIGISSTTVEFEGALRVARLSKETLPGAKIVLGGAHPSAAPEEALSSDYVDYVVRGEGEHTLHDLVSGVVKTADISGLSYKDGGRIIHNPDRPLIDDLNILPMPAYHLLRMDKYRPSLGNYKRLPAISMITSRGCPGRCTFCYTGVSGKKIRMRSVDNMIQEIKLLQKEYKIREISFYDDTFTSLKDSIKEFCVRVIREKIDITWSCMSRVDFVDEETLRLMKSAGCHQIGYGLESASSDILKNIRKPYPVETAKKAVAMTRSAGIDVRAMFILGCPGETEQTLKDTISLAVKLKPDIAVFNICTPLPGTEMYEWAKNNGYLKDLGWSKYDLSNVVMRLPTVSEDKIKDCYHAAYRKFYFDIFYILRRFAKIRTMSDVRNNMRSFFSLLSFGGRA